MKTVKPKDLPATLRREALMVRRGMEKAAMAAARRFRAHLADATDRAGITDQGVLKNSWVAERIGNTVQVYSNAPHAGVIELGCRPHKVSRAGIEAIAGWVKRKAFAPKGPVLVRVHGPTGRVERKMPRGRTPDDEALSIAYAIAHKIEREGQKPKYLVRNELPKASAFYREEMSRILRSRSQAAS